MPKRILFDELHLAFYVPRGLSDVVCEEIRLGLTDAHFVRKLHGAIKAVIRQYPALGAVRITISR